MQLLTASQGIVGNKVLEVLPNEGAIAIGENPKVAAASVTMTIYTSLIGGLWFTPFVSYHNILWWIVSAIVLGFVIFKITNDKRDRKLFSDIASMIPTQFNQIATSADTSAVGGTVGGVGVGAASTTYNISESIVFHIKFIDGGWAVVRSCTNSAEVTNLINSIGDRYHL